MRRRILLADDSVTIQKVIELTFMDEDYEVRAVSNGDDAIKALPEVDPHFVIADVHMPGANGYDVCRRSKERRPDVPVLLLVGTFEPFDEAQARAAGADSFLKKPFDSQELLQRVGDYLSQPAAGMAGMGGPAETVRMSAMSPISDLSFAPEPEPPAPPVPEIQEWRGFEVEVEAEPEPFIAGSEFSLEEPQTESWRTPGYAAEDDQLFALEEEPAPLTPPSDNVFGFEPQPISPVSPISTRSAGFELPLSETDRLGVPEHSAPLVESLEEVEHRIEAPAPASLEESHEPQADAKMAVPAAVAAGTAAVAGIGGNGGLSDADVDRIARRVVELLGDKTVRDVAWEVLPDLAEVVIRDRLRELESQAENLE
ncbi:MAG TPA: response regulator [Thermoanaerobaculia bacterium]|nr:response regulator [Thermoanaerobaculia bacterium]